ncbi:MAG: UvrB/UvrC motif-containing protein [Thermogutta sp.]
MKCQKCDRPATYHITELTGPMPVEVHLCEQHAQEYLGRGSESSVEMTQVAEQMAQQLAKHMIVGQAAEEMKRLDQQSCPYCGITFYKFRNQGRLGCPRDYQVFREQLETLLANIHGDTHHKGKASLHGAKASQTRTELIRLRQEMRQAIENEEYERASQLRDEIRRIESAETT